MEELNADWVPQFDIVYTWYAMDKNGRIATMINNRWGNLPKCILKIEGIEGLLDSISEYLYEESINYKNNVSDKKGEFKLDMYSFGRYKGNVKQNDVINYLIRDLNERKNSSDVNFVVNKGLFIYEAVEGNKKGEDYPVGYGGATEMGDYFRYLMPTIYGSIEDLPSELRQAVAVSDSIDFEKDRLLRNDLINEYFLYSYC